MNFLIKLLLFAFLLNLHCLCVFSFQFKYDFVAGQEGKGRKVSNQPVATNVNVASKFDPLVVSSSNSISSTLNGNDPSAIEAWQKRVERIHLAKKSSFSNLAGSFVSNAPTALVAITNDLKAVESKPTETFAPNITPIAPETSGPATQVLTKPVSTSIASQQNASSSRFTANAQRRSQTITSNNRLKQIPSRFVSKPFASNRPTSTRLAAIASTGTSQSNAIKPKVFVANRRPATRIQSNNKPLVTSNANRNRPITRSEIKPIASQTRRWNSNRAVTTLSSSKPQPAPLNTIINTGAPFGFSTARNNRNQSTSQSSVSFSRARPAPRFGSSTARNNGSARQVNSNRLSTATTLTKPVELANNLNSKPTLAKWDQFLSANQNQNTSFRQQPSSSSKAIENTFAKRSGFVANFKPIASTSLTANRRSQKPQSKLETVATFKAKDSSQSFSSSSSIQKQPSVRNEVIVESPSRATREQESVCKGSKLGKRFGPDMDIWCKANCKAGHCPPIYCSCS